ncbi:MAG: hypothetical protein KF678_13780 [Phycisphaeraceae bacterium]|nr:hypothetical protein [Phycisphaeraceae bacterium]
MADLKSARLMYVKAFLLVGIGVLAATLILIETRSWRIAALLAAAIWGFCRSYYFAFYVIERWIDPKFKFAGLGAFAAYLIRRRT